MWKAQVVEEAVVCIDGREASVFGEPHGMFFSVQRKTSILCISTQDNKHQRQMPFTQVLDAMEYEMPSHRHGPPPQTLPTGGAMHALDELADPHHTQGENHTFKIVTTKRSILLCAPSEEEEIRWLSAVRALIARRSVGVGGKTAEQRA